MRGIGRRRIFSGRSRPESMPPPGQHEIEREELSRVFGKLIGARLVAGPILVAAVAWLVSVEPVAWRRAVLAAAAVLVPGFFVVEWLRFRRRGFTRYAIPYNFAAAGFGVTVLTFASGGLASPFVYVMVPLGIMAGVFIHGPLRIAILGFQIGVVWLCALIGATGALSDFNLTVFGGGPRVGAPPAYLYAHAVMISLVLLMAGKVGRAVRSTLDSIIRRGLAAQQESLRAHAERAEELTALSGEIAHELKNPLASVKGLAGLLAQQVPDGKGAERLQVLRREVDRMQSVLDEFLNFSRPLVPLALGDADVGALCREVAALHEGLARERGVEVSAGDAEIRVRCDPRKVKQVLINLVQNAIDASPPGARVELEAEARGGGARVTVSDRGRGLDPAIAEAAFSPGVTTKPAGSGLGLTIARALARQHGGEVALSARPGGGTRAELVLPPPRTGGDRAA
ncbi:MAG TPA: HAMP domain-containing sensor histidine kinase [Anaeromyxobacter sp.]